jgi:protein N-terminal methyltransferase
MAPKGKKKNQQKKSSGGKNDDKKFVIDTTRDPQELLSEFVAKESGADSRGVKYSSLKGLWEEVLSKSQQQSGSANTANNTNVGEPLTVVQHGSSNNNNSTQYISGEEFVKRVQAKGDATHDIIMDELEDAQPEVKLTVVNVKHDEEEEDKKSETKSANNNNNKEKSDKESASNSNQNQITFQSWYRTSTEYWKDIDASNNGMLGGFAHISDADILGSYRFLIDFLEAKQNTTKRQSAIDFGAGIGRITKLLLAKLFKKVDLVEQNDKFLARARTELEGNGVTHRYLASALQDFKFDAKYDVIWVQWVLLYLTDTDLIEFLRRCKTALSENGVIVVKENCTDKGFVLDVSDCSITRSVDHLRLIFHAAGLTLVREDIQTDFPKKLLPVRMFALK